MSWKELLEREIDLTYKVTDGLMELADQNSLEWKPSAENNWMTMGQLLMHLTNACGMAMRGFIRGDWGFGNPAHCAQHCLANVHGRI